ncbi:glucose-6-phosphate dehydrogenase [Microbacterium sp. SS28]|uniref:glucose-6-phosphate dehydrogenase n=1 Tax=Microbacterium sp. SS28 TaxID=2919948 RepID=UPI001FAAA1B5|nr:glucose-6-phosphate dehydrogenase [Microbacterium sp. SS28]
MKIVASADWRDSLPFETPVLVADLAPGDDARCVGCGADSEPLPRRELWAVKHQHPKHHGGFVRFYCAQHKPAPAPRPVAASVSTAPGRAPRRTAAERPAPVRRPTAPQDRVRAMCPNCFVEVSATGACGICGTQI